jgi:hypothetical protein
VIRRHRRRYLLLALVALAVPLPAFGLGSDPAPPQALTVSASLEQCGIAATTVVCKFDASYNSIAGARYYTASVTGPDGSVVDYGDVGAASTSLWVPYVGDGTYTISISAWGAPVANKPPKPIASGTTSAGGSPDQVTTVPGAKTAAAAPASHASASSSSAPGQSSSNPGPTAPSTKPSTPPDSPGTTTCKPAPAPPPPPPTPPTTTTPSVPPDPNAGDGSQGPPPIAGVSQAATDSMSTSGEVPSYTNSNCPDPTATTPAPDGTCCPPPAG